MNKGVWFHKLTSLWARRCAFISQMFSMNKEVWFHKLTSLWTRCAFISQISLWTRRCGFISQMFSMNKGVWFHKLTSLWTRRCGFISWLLYEQGGVVQWWSVKQINMPQHEHIPGSKGREEDRCRLLFGGSWSHGPPDATRSDAALPGEP